MHEVTVRKPSSTVHMSGTSEFTVGRKCKDVGELSARASTLLDIREFRMEKNLKNVLSVARPSVRGQMKHQRIHTGERLLM